MTSLIPVDRLDEIELGPEERSRYARHLTLGQVGIEGQKRLKAARVLCVGVGGLGSPVALQLAAAGVGTLGLVDPDRVEMSNLQRQIAHGTGTEGWLKVESARKRLLDLNPAIRVEIYPETFGVASAGRLVEGYDLLIDGSDNFATRYLSNDIAYWAGIPNVYGSVYQFEGQCSVFAPALGGPCYRCMFPEPPLPGEVPSCAEAGVLGVLPGMIGTLQATEALKLILGIGEPLVGRLLHWDALTMKVREFRLRKHAGCPLCGPVPEIRVPVDYGKCCGMPGDEGPGVPGISAVELKSRMEAGESLAIIDVRERAEREICKIEGSIAIPLGELRARSGEIPRDRPVILHCKSGVRSAEGLALLRGEGFCNIDHLEGGIISWAEQIDPTLARY